MPTTPIALSPTPPIAPPPAFEIAHGLPLPCGVRCVVFRTPACETPVVVAERRFDLERDFEVCDDFKHVNLEREVGWLYEERDALIDVRLWLESAQRSALLRVPTR